MVLNLEEDHVGVVLLGFSNKVKEGDSVKRTRRISSIKVGEKIVGQSSGAVAVVAEKFIRDLDLDRTKVNVNGGAIALGHPIGASGARILVTLLYEMKKQNKSKGCATLCIGGGMGIALCVERI